MLKPMQINAFHRTQNNSQLNLFDRFHWWTVHAHLYLSSEFSKFSLVSFAPNTAQWLCSFPLSTHQLMGGCDTKQLWMVDRHDGRYLESPDLSGKLSASGLSASSHPAVPSSMSGGQPRTGSTGEASLSLPPACPCLEQAHTASTANHPCCQPFANTSKRPKHLGSGSKNNETLLLCGLLANCTFLLQAAVISAAAAEGESQLDLRRLYLARQHSAGFFLHQWLAEQLYNYLLCWLILIPDQLFSTTQKRSHYYMILLFLASAITFLRS